MKQKIDALVAKDNKVQHFLSWLEEKSHSIDTPYKPTAIRAFYTEDYDFLYGLDRSLSCDFALYFEPSIDPEVECAYNNMLEDLRIEEMYPDFSPSRSNTISSESYSPSNLDISLDWNLAIDFDLERILVDFSDEFHAANLYPDIHKVACYTKEPILKHKLEILADQIQPYVEEDWENWYRWWSRNRQAWIRQFRTAIIQHRNIGHDWQFSQEQKDLLQQYFYANKLLVACLNSGHSISNNVRQEIEDNLLLPIATLRERLPEMYGE